MTSFPIFNATLPPLSPLHFLDTKGEIYRRATSHFIPFFEAGGGVIQLYIYLSICLPACLPAYQPIYPNLQQNKLRNKTFRNQKGTYKTLI